MQYFNIKDIQRHRRSESYNKTTLKNGVLSMVSAVFFGWCIFGMGRRETFWGGRRGLEFSRMPRVIIIIPRERQRGVEFCRSAVNNFSRMAA